MVRHPELGLVDRVLLRDDGGSQLRFQLLDLLKELLVLERQLLQFLVSSFLGLREARLYETSANGEITVNGPLTGGARIAGVLDLGPAELRVPASSGVAAQRKARPATHVASIVKKPAYPITMIVKK